MKQHCIANYMMLKLVSFLVLFLITLKCNVTAWGNYDKIEAVVEHVTSASWAPGRFDIFGVSPDGAVWHKLFVDSVWGEWTSIGGSTARKPSAYSIKFNWIDVMCTGSDQKLYRKTWNGNTWIDWQVDPNDGLFSSGPSLAANNDKTNLHVVGIGIDNQMYHCVIDITNNQWRNWELLGGNLVGDPASVSWDTGRFDVFAIGFDQQLWQKTYNGGWQDWIVVPGGLFKSGVGAASKGPGSINVFLVGLENSVYHRQYANGHWGDLENVGGTTISSASAVASTSTRVDVFVVGNDNQVYRNFWETESETSGCYEGYCWMRCTTAWMWVFDLFQLYGWCYSTKSGEHLDSKYVKCVQNEECDPDWRCADICLGY